MSEIQIKIDSIKLVDINDLKLNKDNRNHHPQDQIEELARHYKVHGMRTPIIVSNQSGQIVAGNGRFLAAKRAGLTQLPVSYQDFETPDKEYAYGIADNGLSLWSELDFSSINKDITDLGPDFDIADLGLKDFTIDVADKEINNTSKELDIGEFSNFDHQCPKCGFEWDETKTDIGEE